MKTIDEVTNELHAAYPNSECRIRTNKSYANRESEFVVSVSWSKTFGAIIGEGVNLQQAYNVVSCKLQIRKINEELRTFRRRIHFELNALHNALVE
jgi:hypothetical protein